MKKSALRNVYALNGVPFVIAAGHRLYAKPGQTLARHGQKLFCSEPVVTENSITLNVTTQFEFGEYVETWGGNHGTNRVELLPKPKMTRGKRVKKFTPFFKHPCLNR